MIAWLIMSKHLHWPDWQQSEHRHWPDRRHSENRHWQDRRQSEHRHWPDRRHSEHRHWQDRRQSKHRHWPHWQQPENSLSLWKILRCYNIQNSVAAIIFSPKPALSNWFFLNSSHSQSLHRPCSSAPLILSYGWTSEKINVVRMALCFYVLTNWSIFIKQKSLKNASFGCALMLFC